MSRTVARLLSAPLAAAMLVGSALTAAPASAAGGWISIANASVTEGDSGQVSLVFTVSLVEPANIPVSARFIAMGFHSPLQPGDAVPGSACGSDVDFVALDTVVTIPANTNPPQITVAVPVCGDTRIEGNEIMAAGLLDVQGSTCLETCAAIGTILDNDVTQSQNAQPATLSVGNASSTEGDGFLSLQRSLTFPVTLSAARSAAVTVDFQTATKAVTYAATPGTFCGFGTDYRSASGTLTFNPGELRKNVTVQICGDTVNEPDEILLLRLTNPTNATIADGLAIGTIVDDDR